MSNTTIKKCYICKTNNGLSTQELYLANNHSFNSPYPLLSLAFVFNCNCNHIFVHNNCVKHHTFCLCCAKKQKPNVVLDSENCKKYFWWIIEPFKKNKYYINYLKYYVYIVIGIIICFHINSYFKIIYINIDANYFTGYCIIMFYFSVVLTIQLLDYFKKYWLI